MKRREEGEEKKEEEAEEERGREGTRGKRRRGEESDLDLLKRDNGGSASDSAAAMRLATSTSAIDHVESPHLCLHLLLIASPPIRSLGRQAAQLLALHFRYQAKFFSWIHRGKNVRQVSDVCIHISLLTLAQLAPGTRTLLPSPSAGDTLKKTSQACIRVMSSPSGPRTCAQSQKYKVSKRQLNVPYIPRTPNWDSRNNNGNGRERKQIRGHPHFE
jgi:hypothetical protein